MRRLFEKHESTETHEQESTSAVEIADGALDTLGAVMRTMGDESFPLDTDPDPELFRRECDEFVRHIENGESVPCRSIPRSTDGRREWSMIRKFFNERRRAENSFVVERIGNYREVVEDLIAGLRRIGERDQDTQRLVTLSLTAVENAVATGELMRIRSVFKQTLEQVTETFESQKRAYESQLEKLNERMSTLREDLVAAREEMQRDSLTDAFNRRAFDAAIEQSLNMHCVLRQPVTLAMIDLDNFKSVNDQFGHPAGDQILRQVGECLARTFIRKSDFYARYGGDEFAVILNETNARSADRLFERFVERVAAIDVVSNAQSVSCSVGYTEFDAGDTIETLLRRADRALYTVKSRGGNGAEFRSPADDQASRSA